MKLKRPSPKEFGDGLAFLLNSRDQVRIDDCTSQFLGGYSPSEFLDYTVVLFLNHAS